MSVCGDLVALTGTRLSGARAGVLGGFAFALVPNVQMYAREGRSYALVRAFVALATYLRAAAAGRRSPRLRAGCGAALVVASYLRRFAVLALLTHGITVASPPLPKPVGRQWAVAAAVVAATSPPAVVGAGRSGRISWIGMPGGHDWAVVAATTVIGLLGARLAAPGPRRPFSLSALCPRSRPPCCRPPPPPFSSPRSTIRSAWTGTSSAPTSAWRCSWQEVSTVRPGGCRGAAPDAECRAGPRCCGRRPLPRSRASSPSPCGCAPRRAARTTSPGSPRPYGRSRRTGTASCSPVRDTAVRGLEPARRSRPLAPGHSHRILRAARVTTAP